MIPIPTVVHANINTHKSMKVYRLCLREIPPNEVEDIRILRDRLAYHDDAY